MTGGERDIAQWLFPVGTFAVPATVFVGAHYGAGTSTWAALLDGADCGLLMPGTGAVVGLCRSTPAGLAAAKSLIGRYGKARFLAFLVVADAPSKMLPRAAREVKVLSGAVPVVAVPWVAQLRGLESPAAPGPGVRRPVRRVRDNLAAAAAQFPR